MNAISGEQKLFAAVAHLSYLLGGLGFIIAPLLIMILKKESDPFVYEHAKQALVAHLTVLVASTAIGLSTLLLIGFLLLPLVAVFWLMLLVTSIIATIKVLNGELYRYPLIQGIADKI